MYDSAEFRRVSEFVQLWLYLAASAIYEGAEAFLEFAALQRHILFRDLHP